MRVFFVFVVVSIAAVVFPIVSQGIQQNPCGEGLVQIAKKGEGTLIDKSCVTPDIAERFSSSGWQIVTPGKNIAPSLATEAVEEASRVAEEMTVGAGEVAEEAVEETVASTEEMVEEVVEEASEVTEETVEKVEEVAEETVEEVTEEASEVAEETAEEVTEEASEVAEGTVEEVEEVAEEAATGAEEAVVAAAATQVDFEWQDLGETTYSGICASCHQITGEGVASAFPALANHLPNVEAKEGGRKYLINVVLYGLGGQIETLGQTYNGMMAPWNAMFSDEEIAAVLNHELHSWGNSDMLRADFTPITPDEVATERAEPKTPDEVYELRSQLGLTADE